MINKWNLVTLDISRLNPMITQATNGEAEIKEAVIAFKG